MTRISYRSKRSASERPVAIYLSIRGPLVSLSQFAASLHVFLPVTGAYNTVPMRRLRNTKIIATLGPASPTPADLRALFEEAPTSSA